MRGGYWAEVEDGGVVVVWDQNETGFDHDRPVISVLHFLANYGFLDGDDVFDAFELLSLAADCRCRRPRRGVRRALGVISNLKLAGE
jgi:hypothetical protein